MTICGTIIDVGLYLSEARKKYKSIGFVPTMGALHSGHISLLKQAQKECQFSICSIFVNPTQFNDKNDLLRYPRMPEKDLKMLEKSGCDLVFMPSEKEIYPQTDTRSFDFGTIDKVLEGAHRPGHFNGVAQVVSRLFDIVKPDKAYFGLKDYQQVLVIRKMTEKLNLPVEVIACPIIREADGLAMSSRNMLLSPAERKAAALIPKLMQQAKEQARKMPLADLKNKLLEEIKTEPLLKPDYIEFCDADTLAPVSKMAGDKKIICLAAIFSGKIRLIDNCFI